MIPELLLPAKDLMTVKTAFMYGADAVYLGAPEFGLRSKATNLTLEEIKEACDFAHKRNKKIYITANIIARNSHIEKAGEFFRELKDIAVDGVLVADPGMFRVLKKSWPEALVHISTQAGNLNFETIMFWYDLGVRRIVCERLMTLSEIKRVREIIPKDMELEAFAHGAMCISFSGRCLLSATFTGMDANLGECTHPCRWKYSLVEERREGEYYPIEEDENGTYIMNSKDLCMIDVIPDMIDAGISSLKIEGRMKNILYVATMAKAYRRAIDTCVNEPERFSGIKDELFNMTLETTHRPYSHGFYFGDSGNEGIEYSANNYATEYKYLGIAEECQDNTAKIIQKNKFSTGDEIEIISPMGENKKCKVISIKNQDGEEMESCPHPGQVIYVTLDHEISDYDILRCKGEDILGQ